MLFLVLVVYMLVTVCVFLGVIPCNPYTFDSIKNESLMQFTHVEVNLYSSLFY